MFKGDLKREDLDTTIQTFHKLELVLGYNPSYSLRDFIFSFREEFYQPISSFLKALMLSVFGWDKLLSDRIAQVNCFPRCNYGTVRLVWTCSIVLLVLNVKFENIKNIKLKFKYINVRYYKFMHSIKFWRKWNSSQLKNRVTKHQVGHVTFKLVNPMMIGNLHIL